MKLKTRTNQPVYYKLPVSSNIQSLSDDLLNSLKVGDVVQKKTGNAKHCYIVTYKEEKHGICLSYFDGSGYLETISYDYTDGHWVYNSKDVTQVPSDTKIADIVKSQVEGGTLNNAKPIYWHGIEVNNITGTQYLQLNIVFLLNDNTPIDSLEKLFNKIESLGADAFINIDGFFNVDSLGMSNATSFYVHENQNIYLNGNNSSCERKSVSKSSADWITYLNAISGIRVVDRINKIN